jgi:hypothetical protein
MEINSKQDCINAGGKWQNYTSNYDNIYNAIINIFKITLGENWVNTMWLVVDSVGIDK